MSGRGLSRGAALGIALLAIGSATPLHGQEGKMLTTAEALALPQPAADHRLAYGPGPLQFGELRLPEGKGPFPVAIVLHGGCWLAAYDLGYVAGLASALAAEGIATWSVEYRRVGDEGGGWPGTFLDVAAGADHLRALAERFPLDLGRVVALGHSAGGHLALWLGGRRGLPAESALASGEPLALSGVVGLAPIADLAAFSSETGCGAAVPDLLGGAPGAVPERLRLASPIAMLPLGLPQRLLVGAADPVVPPAQVRAYAEAARKAGDEVTLVEIPAAGHFEAVVPGSAAWTAVREAVRGLLGSPHGE